jgi:hypothetical protein
MIDRRIDKTFHGRAQEILSQRCGISKRDPNTVALISSMLRVYERSDKGIYRMEQ